MSAPKTKNKSVKFILTPRPQKDPLAADNEAPQHILIPKDGKDIDRIREELPDLDPEVFSSKQETRVGMLERAHNADGLTFDTDLLKAMSKDFDFEDPDNILDDDFMDQAGGLIEDEGDIPLEFDEVRELHLDGINDDDNDFGGEDEGDNISVGNGSETKSVFTNFSMTSSVMRRNQGLQQIDEHFERLYEKEYADDTEIGALDLNEVKGEELLCNIDQIQQLKREVREARKRNHGDDYEPEIVSEHHKNAIIGDEPAAEDEDLVEVEILRRENNVDCESILTYNSNLYNHPKLIVEPRKRTTSRDTSGIMGTNRSRSDKGESVASSLATIISKLSVRPDNETPSERKERKKALKQYRLERRQERKLNQQIFKSEHDNLMRQKRSNQPALKLA